MNRRKIGVRDIALCAVMAALLEVSKLLTDNPLFVIINSYTTGLAPSAVGYAADVVFGAGHGGSTAVGELGLPVQSTGLMLPCGAAGRWTP